MERYRKRNVVADGYADAARVVEADLRVRLGEPGDPAPEPAETDDVIAELELLRGALLRLRGVQRGAVVARSAAGEQGSGPRRVVGFRRAEPVR